MTTQTPNYLLWLYNSTTDQAETFLDYRSDIAGTSAASNMNKIDVALGAQDVLITALEARKNIIQVDATYISPNYYEATVSSISAYTSGDIIDIVLDIDSDATVTLNINALGTKSLMKINSLGTPVNLDNVNLRADRHYLFTYDGTRYVWMTATSADQIDIGGTTGNFVSIALDGSIEDSTSKAADFSSSLTYSSLAPTTANVSISPNTMTDLNISGLTANRSAVLGAPTEAGETIIISILAGDVDYAIIIIGDSGISINNEFAATEWSRLFISGETVTLKSTSTSNYRVVQDGRIPCVCKIIETDSSATTIPTASITQIELNVADIDNASMANTGSYNILCRRDGDYNISPNLQFDAFSATSTSADALVYNASSAVSRYRTTAASGSFLNLGKPIKANLSSGDTISLRARHASGVNEFSYPSNDCNSYIEIEEIL